MSALRTHASHTLRELADVLDSGGELVPTHDLVERVRQLAARD